MLIIIIMHVTVSVVCLPMPAVATCLKTHSRCRRKISILIVYHGGIVFSDDYKSQHDKDMYELERVHTTSAES